MSASYWLTIDTGGSEEAVLCDSMNVTYNLGPMLRAAGFPDWNLLKDAPAVEAAGMLDKVARILVERKDELIDAHTPPNGWGSWEWANEFITRFRDACAAHPRATIRASL